MKRRHDTQHNDDTWYNNTKLDDTQLEGLIRDTHHKRHSAGMTLSITTLCIKCHYAECRNTKCRDLLIVMLCRGAYLIIELQIAIALFLKLIKACNLKYKLTWGVQYLTGDNLKDVWAKFSTLSLAVFVWNVIEWHRQERSHIVL